MEAIMPNERVTVDDIVEAAAKGALRALDARRAGEQAVASTSDLVQSGFTVQIVIRAGGYPPGPPWDGYGGTRFTPELNPQPLPPG
jgi:hypothetical protein